MRLLPDLLRTTYRLLEHAYGLQGWWPLVGRAGTPGYDPEGYLVDPEAARPLADEERLEIALGAVLTQNTAWENARRAVVALRDGEFVSTEALRDVESDKLARVIRSSGYFNQKARKLKLLARSFERMDVGGMAETSRRSVLLEVWGVGPETADSILLYAYGEPHFIADAYARRVFRRVGVAQRELSYDELQATCHQALPRDRELYGEYHALLVRHARTHCRKTPICEGCPLRRICSYARS